MIPKQTVNMQNVAERLGVSISTVSRALRGLPGVAETTRTRILREAEALSTSCRRPPPPSQAG